MLLVDPVQSTLRMHEGDPMVRSRITGNQGEYTHTIPLRNAETHRTNCVVTGGKTCSLICSSTTTSSCLPYLSIPIMGRSLSFGRCISGGGCECCDVGGYPAGCG